jgi:hypothetical protein
VASFAVALPLAIAPAAAQAQQDQAQDEDVVVIVGSRIARTGFEDISQPALVVDSDVLDQRGFTNIADALTDLPGFGAGVDGIGNSGANVGQEFLDLFDLGTQRTLVVVNGRRFVPGNPPSSNPDGRVEGSQVDINNIPAGLVERVEALSVGGAPIYGADAVAGVVNIVLKDNFEGAEASFQYGDFFTANAPVYNVQGLFGANFSDGRGNVTASVQYEKQIGARQSEFPFLYRDDADTFPNAANPRIITGQEAIFNILEGPNGFLPAPGSGVPLPTFGANVFTDAQGNILTFAGDGKLSVFDPGDSSFTSSAIQAADSSAFDSNGDFGEAIVPVERFVFSSTAHMDLNDNVRVFMETNFLNSYSADIADQRTTAFNTAFLSLQGAGSFGVRVGNPFISTGDRQLLINSSATDTIVDDNSIFYLNGILLNALPSVGANSVDTTTYRVVGGLEGDFEWWDRNFNWEVSMNYGRTKQYREQPNLRGDAYFNAIDSTVLDAASIAQMQTAANQALLVASVNAGTVQVLRNNVATTVFIDPTASVTAGDTPQVGDIACNVFLNAPGAVDNPGNGLGISAATNTPTPDAAVLGCVPFNPFAGEIPVGSPGGNVKESIDFITGEAHSNGMVAQTDFLAFIGGDFIELPAGWSQFSIGVERRRDFGSFGVSSAMADVTTRGVQVLAFPQREVVSEEFYGEMVIPVLDADFDLGINDVMRGFGFAEFLTNMQIDGAYRRIEPSSGSGANVFTAGGSATLLGGELTIRGNRTRSVRAPSIIELFAPVVLAFDQTGDPCDVTNIANGNAANRQANCVTAAVAAGFAGAAVGTGSDGLFGLLLAPGDNAFNTPSVNASIPLLVGGNENLAFEVANSFTGGFIYQPEFVPGLTIGADYISIVLNQAITQPDFSFFPVTCFEAAPATFAATPPGECGNFTRIGPQASPADGSVIGGFDIVTGTSGFGNTDAIDFQALQAQMRYQFEVRDLFDMVASSGPGDMGSMSVTGTVYKPLAYRDTSQPTALTLQANGKVANLVGSSDQVAIESVNAAVNFHWIYKEFDFFTRVEYEGRIAACVTRLPADCATTNAAQVPLARDIEIDVSGGYNITDNVEIRAGISNVLQNIPTFAERAFGSGIGVGGGNSYGRSYFMRLNFRG